MSKPVILAVVGSLRKGSYNRQLALAAQKALGDRADFSILEYADLPMLNTDIEFPAPEPVARVRDQVRAADGVWFFSPENNHFFSAALKNLIDWLSRSEGKDKPKLLSGKPAALSGISDGMSGTLVGMDNLVALLSFLNMKIMNLPRLTIPNILMQVTDGKLELTTSAPYLEKQAGAFLKFIEENR